MKARMKDIKAKFDFSKYLLIVVRRKWFFVIPLIVIYTSFLVSSHFLPKVYEAKAIILIEEKKVVNPLLHKLHEQVFKGEKLIRRVQKLSEIDSEEDLTKIDVISNLQSVIEAIKDVFVEKNGSKILN